MLHVLRNIDRAATSLQSHPTIGRRGALEPLCLTNEPF